MDYETWAMHEPLFGKELAMFIDQGRPCVDQWLSVIDQGRLFGVDQWLPTVDQRLPTVDENKLNPCDNHGQKRALDDEEESSFADNDDRPNKKPSTKKWGKDCIDITPYFRMPQTEVARVLGIATSTLSKRWTDAARGRKWPYRKLMLHEQRISLLNQKTVSTYVRTVADAERVAAYKREVDQLQSECVKMLKPVVIKGH